LQASITDTPQARSAFRKQRKIRSIQIWSGLAVLLAIALGLGNALARQDTRSAAGDRLELARRHNRQGIDFARKGQYLGAI